MSIIEVLLVGALLALAVTLLILQRRQIRALQRTCRVQDEQMDRLMSEAGAANTQTLRVENLFLEVASMLEKRGVHEKGCEIGVNAETGEVESCSCGLATMLKRAAHELGED